MVSIVSLKDVVISYDKDQVVLRNVNLTVNPGDFYFLTGASGSGKSSLLKLMYLAIRPTGGMAKVFNQDVTAMNSDQVAKIRQHIGVVFQDFNLLDHLTVYQNVMLPLKIMGIAVEQRQQQALELLAWVGLQDHLQAYPTTLSGGQRQLVAIARAVVTRPRLLIADEPTGSVDEKMAMRLLYLFEELHKAGTSVIIATHYRDFARVLGYPELIIKNHQVEMVNRYKTHAA